MPDPLAVSADGLHAASGRLTEQAHQVIGTNGASPTSGKPSAVGAANIHAAISTFSRAYSGLLADHGRSADVAAASYATSDEHGKANVTTVSV